MVVRSCVMEMELLRAAGFRRKVDVWWSAYVGPMALVRAARRERLLSRGPCNPG